MNCMWAADEDVTPAHLNFAAQPEGPYEFVHYSSTGSNPATPFPEADLKATGTVVLTGGQVKNDNASVAGFNKGCHIVASEYGNMLLIKGNGSSEAPDLSEADALGGYVVVNMFTTSDFPTNTPVRFQFVSKVVGDVTSDYKVAIYNYGGSTVSIPLSEKTAYSPIDTKWWPVIYDLDISTITGDDRVPLRVKYSIPGAHANGRAVYIASIKFTANPSTECPELDPNSDGWDTPDGSPVSSAVEGVESAQGFVAWDRQNIYLNEMELGSTVYIYSITGSLVKTIQVNDSFMEVPMNQGVYVVKYGDKTSKVVL
ncbi:hypothetical protein [Barnesiella viscericola]|uniref:hypothetical protein n=1 Tax=Barnesiella viscericola TaxID=397865 RepID=UPI0023524066|nr:hypothetical protein [Barnesiella viscericola]